MKKRKSIENEMKLKELGEITGGTRVYTRCKRCGRPHSIVRKYNLCTICYREALKRGELPGRDF